MPTPDTEAPEQPASAEETASKLGVIALLCFLLPFFYFLSTGPYMRAQVYGYIPESVAVISDKFYVPLFYITDRWEWLWWLYCEYAMLWV